MYEYILYFLSHGAVFTVQYIKNTGNNYLRIRLHRILTVQRADPNSDIIYEDKLNCPINQLKIGTFIYIQWF
jgi:hypothetical protein